MVDRRSLSRSKDRLSDEVQFEKTSAGSKDVEPEVEGALAGEGIERHATEAI